MACPWARAECRCLLCPPHQQQYTDNSSHSRNNSTSTQHKVSHCMPAFCRYFLSLCLLLTTFPLLLTAANSMGWINKCIVVSGLTKSFFSVPNISIKIPKV